MALDGQEILYFMSVGVSATPIPDQSFEELRVRDYLRAYQTSGGPPQPCSQSPDTPNARATLSLAPLFVPTAIPVPVDSINGSSSNAPPTLSTDLPTNHEFRPNKSKINGESFESISAQIALHLFLSRGWFPSRSVGASELRHYAYLAGNKMPPPVLPVTTMNGETVTSTIYPFYAPDSRATAYNTSTPPAGGTPDYLMTIVASPKFEKHSFEELRIAHLTAGKEVGSSEIPTRGALPAQSAPTLFGRPRGDAFSAGSLKLS
ncbi:hypothetical protein JVT61DRAFT_709 [Boletus reticuloceps]|uniref:Uncharacterized protein n=1 Tax=Boletus reticuloceps TaxID=495285 RepID=A0A8I3AH04_9AGAM|nr:hypothetical protein JVT61DRAFT_709 [Boletus reticuloceps]